VRPQHLGLLGIENRCDEVAFIKVPHDLLQVTTADENVPQRGSRSPSGDQFEATAATERGGHPPNSDFHESL
jgi:hypothetical protein